MKLFIWVVLFICVLCIGVYFFIFNVTTIGYEQSSEQSIMQHKNALKIANNLDCSDKGLTDNQLEMIKAKYPDALIARKGNNLLIDGFTFKCELTYTGKLNFVEVKG